MDIVRSVQLLAALVVILIVLAGIGVLAFFQFQPPITATPAPLQQFSSYEELKTFLKERMELSMSSYGYLRSGTVEVTRAVPVPMAEMAIAKSTSTVPVPSTGAAPDYSTTNIQVQGVDEADIVKTDGTYLYVVSGQRIFIIEAYPAETARLLSTIELQGQPQELFINKGRLVVFGNQWPEQPEPVPYTVAEVMPASPTSYLPGRFFPYSSKAFAKVYDLSDPEQPKLKQDITLDGDYVDSRMIGQWVYVVINSPAALVEDEVMLPVLSKNGKASRIKPQDISYSDDVVDYGYRFTTILALQTQQDNTAPAQKVFLTGQTQTIYVSPNAIYTTYAKQLSQLDFMDTAIDSIIPSLPFGVANNVKAIQRSDKQKSAQFQAIEETLSAHLETLSSDQQLRLEQTFEKAMQNTIRAKAKDMQQTLVHKIAIKNGEITHVASGSVPGHALNQFSMDEHNGFFRIATTTGELFWNDELKSANHVYVLDEKLHIVGRLEDLAPGERIYSARFMGERAYLVTFKKIDPLFVLDLSQPSNPRILGKLKIPGYSDYLHPYDENHIIGIGKETMEAEEGDFAWYQGMKLAIFDVSDVTRPKEKAKVIIGDRGTDSYALNDHKAFLFNRERGLLVIPVLLAEIDETQYPEGVPPFTYGDFTFQGAYVFDVDVDGFALKGRVTHLKGDELLKSGYYFDSSASIKRSLYIGDVLYTVSDRTVKMNQLTDLSELNTIELIE